MKNKKKIELSEVFLNHCQSSSDKEFENFVFSQLKQGGTYDLYLELMDGFSYLFENEDKNKINIFLNLPLSFDCKRAPLSLGVFKSLSVDRLDIIDYVLHHPSITINLPHLLDPESAQHKFLLGFCNGAPYHKEMTSYLVDYIRQFNSARLEYSAQEGMLLHMLDSRPGGAFFSHVCPEKILKGLEGAQMIIEAWGVTGSEPYFNSLYKHINQDKALAIQDFFRIRQEKIMLESFIDHSDQIVHTKNHKI